MEKKTIRVPMPQADSLVRKANFNEVAFGYNEVMAKEEASRCLECKKKPCVSGCPVNVEIPSFIEKIKSGEYHKAYDIITNTNALPGICGRVCPQESQCEARCVKGKKGQPVAIGGLERFCADYVRKNPRTEIRKSVIKNGKKVAVIGSGPGGLCVAGDLIKKGYEVTIFEALHRPGGVLAYGIPNFRLPKDLLEEEINTLVSQGVNIECNMVIGKILSLQELQEDMGFDAVFIGTGAGLPNFMNIPGENLNGVFSANEFLTRVNLMKAYDFPKKDTPIACGKRVAVIGGGNVAMDAARCAMRLGAESVTVVYRRSETEMPARLEEVHHGKEEGIFFQTLTNPIEIVGKQGWVTGLRCVEMVLGEEGADGRRRPVVKENSSFVLPVDTVIMAIGNGANPLLIQETKGLNTNPWGCIVVDDATGATSLPGVYAGGDAVTGAATVILAMGAGKIAAAAMDDFLKHL